MNKQEKLFALLLGLALAGWLFYTGQQSKKIQAARAAQAEAERKEEVAVPADTGISSAPAENTSAAPQNSPDNSVVMADPATLAKEEKAMIASPNGDLTLDLSSHGAVISRATLTRFATNAGKLDPEKNPPVCLDFSDAPALELGGITGLPANAAYRLDASANRAEFVATAPNGLRVQRVISVESNYIVRVRDVFKNEGNQVLQLGDNSVSIGAMPRGSSKNDILSMDSLPVGAEKVMFWDQNKDTKKLLAGNAGGGFGCGGAQSAAGMPPSTPVTVDVPQQWVALKSRFFVNVFSSDVPNSGFSAAMVRDTTRQTYLLHELRARVSYRGQTVAQGESVAREYTLFIGPKKLSLLRAMGNRMDDIMEFGFFSWFCKLLVPTLNFFYRLIPNYGIAIILLTFLVRLIFWPLTRKSTESMKKMQEIQPKLKEIQKQFKDNPQKLQQETWAIYRDHKVNPLSSCLPMLIQIPVFIALFTVLRSAVELRYADFLWIRDLSEAENLFAGVLPIPLNILPILMAGTMALQSYLTPSTGDPQQQRMMMILMPVMMLFMFYSFPSALSLYWTVSQVLSIIQMVMIHRAGQKKDGGDSQPTQNLTRQQRRHA